MMSANLTLGILACCSFIVSSHWSCLRLVFLFPTLYSILFPYFDHLELFFTKLTIIAKIIVCTLPLLCIL